MYIHNLSPIAFEIGNFAIRWYSLAYIFGILLAYYYILFLNNKLRLALTNKKDLEDLTFRAILGILIGGRLGYVLFYNFSYYISSPLEILYLWQGGMSFHGGLIGVTLAVFYHCRKANKPFLQYMDLVACGVPIGLFLGRVANFINGELYGKVTNASWGVVFPYADALPRHPTQLYEALLEGLTLLIIMYFAINNTKIRNKAGAISGIFLIFYALFRMTVEFYRIADEHIGYLFSFITTGHILSLPMLILGIVLISRKKSNKLQ